MSKRRKRGVCRFCGRSCARHLGAPTLRWHRCTHGRVCGNGAGLAQHDPCPECMLERVERETLRLGQAATDALFDYLLRGLA